MKTTRVTAFWSLIGLFLIAHLTPHAGWGQREEWNNIASAWLVSGGWAAYRDYFTSLPPFPHWLAAPAVRLFGPGDETFRGVLMLFYVLALAALYQGNRRASRPFSFGMFVLFLALGHVLYSGGHYLAGGIMAFALLLVFCEFWRDDETNRRRRSDWIVIALAVSAAIGSSLAAAVPLALLAVAWAVKHCRSEPRERRAMRALGGIAIVLAPFLCAAAWLWATGALHDFWSSVFRFSAAYAPAATPFAFLGGRMGQALQALFETLLLRHGATDFALAWANVAVVAAVAASGRWAMAVFYAAYVLTLTIGAGSQHSAAYVVQSLWAAAWVLQPVGAQAAATWDATRQRIAPPLTHADVLRTAAAALLLALLGQAYVTSRRTETPPNLAHRDTAKLCAQLTLPGEPIAVLGGSPLVYVESQRKPALYDFCGSPARDGWPDIRRRTIQDIENQMAPVLVVSWSEPATGLYSLSADAPEVRAAIQRNYRPLSLALPTVWARNASFYELLGRYERTRPQRVIEVPEGGLAPLAVFGPVAVRQYFALKDRVTDGKLEVLVSDDKTSDSRADLVLGSISADGSEKILAGRHARASERRLFPGRTDRTYWFDLPLGPDRTLQPGTRYFFECRAPFCDAPGDLGVMTASRQTRETIGDTLYDGRPTSRTVCFRLSSLSPRRPHGVFPIVEQSLARSSTVVEAGEIRQTVTVPEATTLSAVSLLLGSVAASEKHGAPALSTSATAEVYTFEIRSGGDNRPLASQTFSPPQSEREWRTFAFPPLGLIPYERLSLVVRADRPSTPPLRLWSAGGDVYWGGRLSVAGKELDDDLCFKLYETAPERSGLPDIVVGAADFQPAAPASISPREPLRLTLRIENRGGAATGAFWVEFFALPKDLSGPMGFAADSLLIMNLAPGEVFEQTVARPLRPLRDGLYSLSVVADRVAQVAESNEENNRFEVSGKDLLVVTSESQVNLFVSQFGVSRSPLRRGRTLELAGIVSNYGKTAAGPFRVEFWAASDPDQRQLRFPICDPIVVESLAPYAILDLSQYPRTLKAEMPVGRLYVGCTVDGRDEIAEIIKSDNTAVVGPLTIEP